MIIWLTVGWEDGCDDDPDAPALDTDLGAVLIGESAALFENDVDGGRIFLNGQLCWVWDAGQDDLRRLAAVQLVRVGAARVNEVAAGFGVTPESLRRWRVSVTGEGVAALAPVKKGPKGPTVLTGAKEWPRSAASAPVVRACGQRRQRPGSPPTLSDAPSPPRRLRLWNP